jgi:hypothetical protein
LLVCAAFELHPIIDYDPERLGLYSQTVGFIHSHPSPVSSDAPVDIDTDEGTPVKSSR